MRPEGTDGSDYEYREKVVQRYKRMANNLWLAGYIVPIIAVASLLKGAWSMLPIWLDEEAPDALHCLVAIGGLVGVALWYAGSPRKNPKKDVIKFATIAVMLALALHIVSAYSYHVVKPKHRLFPRRIVKKLKDEGSLPPYLTVELLSMVEAVIESIMFLAAMGCWRTLHFYVMDNLNIEKEAEAGATGRTPVNYAAVTSAAAAASQQAGKAAANGGAAAKGPAGAVRRRPKA